MKTLITKIKAGKNIIVRRACKQVYSDKPLSRKEVLTHVAEMEQKFFSENDLLHGKILAEQSCITSITVEKVFKKHP